MRFFPPPPHNGLNHSYKNYQLNLCYKILWFNNQMLSKIKDVYCLQIEVG